MQIYYCLILVLIYSYLPAQGVIYKRPLAVEQGKIIIEGKKKYLWGGTDKKDHFDITNYTLNDNQLHYGLGREAFPALIQPKFISVNQADPFFKNGDRFLLVTYRDETKAYSIKDLTRHEVVNDEIGGLPIMAAYCVLADLGAIYDRNLYGFTFTFALSGYTYFDPEIGDGLDAFVLWDRDTESLWWPMTSEAVSGDMLGAKLQIFDEKYWQETNWKKIKKEFAHAQILRPRQSFVPPGDWPRKEVKSFHFSSTIKE